MRRIFPLIATTLLGALTLSGCSPDAAPDEQAATDVDQSEIAVIEIPQSEYETEPQSKEAAPAKEDFRAYFDQLATSTPEGAAKAVELAAPESNAAAYATYLRAAAQAHRDGGLAAERQKVSQTEDGFSLCFEATITENRCSEYTNIVGADGLIADFDAGGVPLEGRIVLGNGESKSLDGLAQAEFLAAYKAISGYLVVVFDVTSESDGLFIEASYLAPDGRQSVPTDQSGPYNLASGAFSTMSFYFEGAEFGGTVSLRPHSDSTYDTGVTTFSTQN